MTDERDFFTPEQVDQQVEQLFPDSPIIRLPRRQMPEETSLAEERLVRDLQGYHQDERVQDLASLERAWQRVSTRLASAQEHPHSTDQSSPSEVLRSSYERTRMMRKHVSDIPQRGKFFRGLNVLAAVIVAALLVGGLVAVLRLSHQTSVTGSPRTAQVTPTPTTPPLAIGTTVYTTSPDPHGYSGFSWSPDSTRIASINSQGVQFWDATTGKNLVIAHMPGQNEWATSLSWSPNGQNVAVGTNQEILIVNGLTGQVVRSLNPGVPTASAAGSVSSPYLASKFPDSGGFGIRGLAWSPDGNSIAASVSFGPNGAVQIWNAQTGAVTSTFRMSGSYVPTSVAWSSDGAYLAAHAYNSQPPDMNPQSTQPPNDDLVLVWSASTHQQVLRHVDSLTGSDAPISWQPQSHNLTFAGTTRDGKDYVLTFEIWDAVSGKLVKQYPRIGNDVMVWSPDGKEFAYSGGVGTGKDATNAVIIVDASSGNQIYAYKAPPTSVFMNGLPLAWSPDGKYIVSTQVVGQETNNQIMQLPEVAKVWVA